MDDVLRAALRAAGTSGIQYADVRAIGPQRYEHLAVRNGEASALTSTYGAGVGVRVRTDRAWGFGSVSDPTVAGARHAASLAVRSARAAESTCLRPIAVVPSKGPAKGRFESPVRRDPFRVDRSEKLELLRDAERALHVGPEVKSGHASMQAWETVTEFASTEGVAFRSRIVHVGAGVDATAAAHGEVQRRSGPTSFGGDYHQAGYEYLEALDLVERAPVVGREAVALLSAKSCPKATTTIVLATDQLALQVHESVGHATELDRILASEAGYAGTSFLRPDDVGNLTYGSEGMTIVADATEAGGLGTFGWDDEGSPAVRTTLVDHGQLAGFLTNRETAAALGRPSSGATARAGGFDRAPLIRMTNIDLLPGDHSLEELLEGVSNGVYFETNRSWSIDDKRYNFQFGTEVGRRIGKGELGPLLRNPMYAGMTPEFWSSMDAVGDASTWHLWGIPNCGKGQPSQAARVGHGAPAARFRRVRTWGG
ncbi:MAG: TldD/PmbA family protein [Thermoplasmata archaeon]|nr:TldD/PmbA family protein [Thermoplasmata archaeon]